MDYHDDGDDDVVDDDDGDYDDGDGDDDGDSYLCLAAWAEGKPGYRRVPLLTIVIEVVIVVITIVMIVIAIEIIVVKIVIWRHCRSSPTLTVIVLRCEYSWNTSLLSLRNSTGSFFVLKISTRSTNGLNTFLRKD